MFITLYVYIVFNIKINILSVLFKILVKMKEFKLWHITIYYCKPCLSFIFIAHNNILDITTQQNPFLTCLNIINVQRINATFNCVIIHEKLV